ncbi:HNH endonuclease, partial [bacterium]|nr:HNH endonuclease [bacterium]
MKCQICKINDYQNKHHIISKSKGGKNGKNNICYLCSNCHFNVHKNNIIIEGFFLTTEGYQLIFHKKNEESI